MAIEHGYVSEEDLRHHFGDAASSKLSTSLLERAAEASSRAVDLFCGYPSRRFWLDETAQARVYAPMNPLEVWVDDIGSADDLVVKIDTTGTGTFDTTLTLGTDFELMPRNVDKRGLEAYCWTRISLFPDSTYRFLTCLPDKPSRPSVQVTAKGGWSAIPSDVTTGAILKAANLFKRKEAPFGVAGFGELGVVRIGRNDPDVMELLTGYVRTIPAES